MKKNLQLLAFVLPVTLLFSSCLKQPPCKCDDNNVSISTKVFATGLNNPRGLKFGPDGNLYVAEGGTGGTNSTVGQCQQVPPPVGPYKGSPTGGRISRISATGIRTTISDRFPSNTNGLGAVTGVADIAFIGNTLYALIAGGGCSHGVPSIPNQVARVNADGSWTTVANLSAWLMAHPAKNPEPADFEPEGNWYSMVSGGGNLYALEPQQGVLDKITPSGNVSRVADFSAAQGHIVPTALLYRDGHFLVGNLGKFPPVVIGSSHVYGVTPGGQIQAVVSGLTTITGLALDKQNRLYVLETSEAPDIIPGKGTIVRVDSKGNKQTIVSGLYFPTAMTMGPDGKLYVSNIGFGPDALGGGQVMQITLNNCNCEADTD